MLHHQYRFQVVISQRQFHEVECSHAIKNITMKLLLDHVTLSDSVLLRHLNLIVYIFVYQ